MNNIDRQYKELLEYILHFGVDKQDRTGTGTKSIFGWQIRHNMKEGFPLLTTKKMAWKSIVTELVWFLRGDTNIKFLVDNDCHIWDGDCFHNFLRNLRSYVESIPDSEISIPNKEEFINKIKTDDEFAKKWGELGPIYGKQWRQWQGWIDLPNTHYLAKGSLWYDQILMLIHQLKTDPDSRRLMVNAWNVAELDKMVLPPCHYGFQVYTRKLNLEERRKLITPEMHKQIYTGGDPSTLSHSEIDQWSIPKRAISLMWNQRSVDTFLGLPFNIASYGLLLQILAKAVDMIPEELIGNLGDVHLYGNHIEQAKEQIKRAPYKLPRLQMNPIFLANLEHKGLDEAVNGEVNFQLEDYQYHPAIKAPLSN